MTRPITIDYQDEGHDYKINGVAVPSVTEMIDASNVAGGLPWWGMRVGMAAVLRLFQTDKLSFPALLAEDYQATIDGVPLPGQEHFGRKDAKRRKPKTLLELLTIENRLSTNHIRDDAADRGQAIHDAINVLAATGKIPNMDDFAPHVQGYVRAVSRWWLEQEPDFQTMEQIVAHREKRYAGRFDCTLTSLGGREGSFLGDFKTTKRIYDSHPIQLRGYEDAHVSLEGEPHDDGVVIRFDKDGSYEQAWGFASQRMWDAVVEFFYARDAEQGGKYSQLPISIPQEAT